jgi:hypothetical protein
VRPEPLNSLHDLRRYPSSAPAGRSPEIPPIARVAAAGSQRDLVIRSLLLCPRPGGGRQT